MIKENSIIQKITKYALDESAETFGILLRDFYKEEVIHFFTVFHISNYIEDVGGILFIGFCDKSAVCFYKKDCLTISKSKAKIAADIINKHCELNGYKDSDTVFNELIKHVVDCTSEADLLSSTLIDMLDRLTPASRATLAPKLIKAITYRKRALEIVQDLTRFTKEHGTDLTQEQKAKFSHLTEASLNVFNKASKAEDEALEAISNISKDNYVH